ncbi:MAG: sortase [Bacilli bacterium]|nr:sortase [Bacilli bacterium]MBQ9853946.1 sortase [Bacilli bacterium]
MIKKEKNKSRFSIIGSFLIIGATSIFLFYNIYNFYINRAEEKQAEEFINNPVVEDTPVIEETTEEVKEEVKQPETYNYVGVLEIPKINFKRGFLDIKDKNNNVNKNIQVLENSAMPNVNGGLLVIAGHSGSGRVAFFRNLYKLKENDQIYIYYENIKYIYQVQKYYEETKDGDISIDKNSESTLVLTTCSQTDKNKQIVIVSKLIDKTNY